MISEPSEITKLRAQLREAMHGPVKILTPLPRRVRLRLWLTGRIDAIGFWLIDHHHDEAAMRLWRLCGLWGEP